MKIECKTSAHFPVSFFFEINDDDKSCILFLKTQDVFEAIFEQFPEMENEQHNHVHTMRNNRIYDELTCGEPYIYLPVIYCPSDKIRIAEGRHRTMSLKKLNIPVIPCATSIVHAYKMKEYWGSVAEGLTYFNITNKILQYQDPISTGPVITVPILGN